MQYDRQIKISTASSRKATLWQSQTFYWSELVERLRIPLRGTETLAEYLKLPKNKQDDLKDIGGFVGGELKGNRRKVDNVAGRDIITLDLDNIPPGGTNDVLKRVDGLGCSAAIYSTRKHDESKPRIRVVIPINRTVTAEEYEPIARKLAQIMGIQLCDPTTFQVSRLMYWPSCCSDSQYIYQYWDKPFIDADGMLSLYTNWRNISEWPQAPGEVGEINKQVNSKQKDPLEKTGIVGAFCRTYSITDAIAKFLSDIYIPCEIETRYTYAKGSTFAGAIVYDDKFIYSNHATDPAGGKLCNSFDSVRIHLFGELDEEVESNVKGNNLPSYIKMEEFAVADDNIKIQLNKDRREGVKEDFSDELIDSKEWIKKLDLNSKGVMRNTYSNLKVIIENDPNIKGKIVFDEFSNRANIVGNLPWNRSNSKNYLVDSDITNLCEYIEKTQGITISDERIRKVLKASIEGNAINPPKEYLKSLSWDGIKRIDTLLVDYFGADDTEYTRIVTRKWLCGAVARIFEPGIKFDYMLVLVGDQGVGKSTFFQKLGKHWFTDSIQDVEGNQAIEKLIGSWIIEFGELQAFNRAETRALKRFITATEDKTRLAFSRNTEYFKRQCVFAGTTNEEEFLKDDTGDRRYWPVNFKNKGVTRITESNEFENSVDQIWAEAVYTCKELKETLFLTKSQEELAREQQRKHTIVDDRKGLIVKYFDTLLPKEWEQLDISQRVTFINNDINPQGEILRDKVCILEVWVECLYKNKNDIKRADSNNIASIINSMEEWEKIGYTINFGPYGPQKGYKRKNNS